MRRASTPNLTLNDNNQPVGLAFDAFFGTGGAGADLTLYLQTTSAGLVSFTVAGAFLSAGGNWLNVTLPTAARTLLNNLATGDRFIFALARAATVAVDHAVDAGSIAFAFALPQPTVTHTPAAVTTDHAVDAGSVSWAFALPQPTVTHTPASTPILTTTRLFVCDNDGDELWEIDPDGADGEGTLLREFPAALADPRGMTVLNGRLLIADRNGDELWEIDPAGADAEGTLLRDFPSGLSDPRGMTVFNGRLFVVDNTGDELFEIDPDGANSEGTSRTLPGTLTGPGGMTVFDGRLLVVDGTGDELFELDPDGADGEGTKIRNLPFTLTSPGGMAVFNGRLLIADDSGDELWELNPDGADGEGTLLREFPATLGAPVSMAALDVAAGPTDHAVNAGVAWRGRSHYRNPRSRIPGRVSLSITPSTRVAYRGPLPLPQPSVTHTLAAGTTAHAVNAVPCCGPSTSPNPGSRIHSPPALQSGRSTRSRSQPILPRSHDSGPAEAESRLRGGNLYEGGGRAVGVGEIELVSGNPDRRLTITLSSIPDIR